MCAYVCVEIQFIERVQERQEENRWQGRMQEKKKRNPCLLECMYVREIVWKIDRCTDRHRWLNTVVCMCVHEPQTLQEVQTERMSLPLNPP